MLGANMTGFRGLLNRKLALAVYRVTGGLHRASSSQEAAIPLRKEISPNPSALTFQSKRLKHPCAPAPSCVRPSVSRAVPHALRSHASLSVSHSRVPLTP